MKHIDGWLYVGMGILTPLATVLGTDEAKSFLTPPNLFWAKALVVVVNGGFLAGKTYRSITFANQKEADVSETKTVKTTEIKQTSDVKPTTTPEAALTKKE